MSCIDDTNQLETENIDKKLHNKIEAGFKKLEVDVDGYLSEQELLSGMKEFGMNPTEEELQTLMNIMDVDNDGKITIQEFILFLSQAYECYETNKMHQDRQNEMKYILSLFQPAEYDCLGHSL